MPRMNLEGSSSIVTGGASGIGEACGRQLAAAGSRVVIADLNEERGSKIAAEIGGVFVKCDVTQEADGQAVVATGASGLGNPSFSNRRCAANNCDDLRVTILVVHDSAIGGQRGGRQSEAVGRLIAGGKGILHVARGVD